MEIGLGLLGYTPEVFWRLTLVEFRAAYDGWFEKHTGERASDQAGFMSRADLDRLMDQFPDHPGPEVMA